MGNSYSPKIATDGLVLCLDAHDGKSYPGQPTTNLCYSGSGLYQYLAQSYDWDNSGSATRDRDVRNIRKPKAENGGVFNERYIRICSCVVTATGSQHFGMGYTTGNISASTQYMVSLYYRQSKAGLGGPYIRGKVSNANHGALKWIGRDGKQDIAGAANWPVDEWIRLKAYATTAANEDGLYISNYIGSAIGDKIWSYGPQIETGSKFSPLVRQTRSTTDAWKDRSGNDYHGDFAGGVNTGASHYRKGQVIEPKSNAYLDFDGSDDKIDVGPLGTSGEFSQSTISIWFKKDAQVATYGNLFDCNWGVTTANKGPRMEVANDGVAVRIYMGTDAGSYTSISFGNLSNDVWYNAVLTVAPNSTSQDLKTYTNGALVSSSTSSSSYVWDGDIADLYLGIGFNSGRYFTGKIAAFQIYKKVLTAAQVKANFNAQRGRFGV
jgi:hypothetical protein